MDGLLLQNLQQQTFAHLEELIEYYMYVVSYYT